LSSVLCPPGCCITCAGIIRYVKQEGERFPSPAGALLACWAVLVGLNYAVFPAHSLKIPLALDALSQWASAPLSVAGLLAALPGHGRALAAVSAGLVLAWLAGSCAGSWFRASAAPVRLGLGFGAGILAMLGAGMAGLFHPAVFVPGAVLLALPVLARGRFRVPAFLPSAWKGNPAVTPGWVALAALGLAGFSALVNLLGALAPEVGYDSLIQHLADPRAYLSLHRINFNDLSCLAQHPAGLEMLYSWLLPLGGDCAAKLLHLAFGAGAAWSLACFTAARRGRNDAVFMGCVLYLTPFVGILSSRSYVDNGLTYFSVLSLLAPFGSLLQGVMIGLAVSTKYLGGFLLIAWAAALLMGGGWRGTLRIAAAAGLTAGWWGLRSWLNTGNPVYPFGYAVLGGLAWDGHSAAEYSAELASYARVPGFWSQAAVPWLLGVMDRGALDDGSLGAVFLMAAPLMMGYRGCRGKGVLLRVVAASWVLWLLSPRQARYALSILPLTLAAAAQGYSMIEDRLHGSVRRFMHLMPFVLAVQLAVSVAAVYIWVNPFYVAAGIETPNAYLRRVMEPRDQATGLSLYMAQANRMELGQPGRRRVYVLGDAKAYYMKGDVRVNALFNPPLLARIVRESGGARDVSRKLRQRGITHVLYNAGGSIRIEHVHRMFHPSPREFAVIEDFFGRWLKETDRLETSGREPIYMLFEIAPGRYRLPPYLPGVDTYIAGVEEMTEKGERGGAREAAERLLLAYPGSRYLARRIHELLGR